MSEQRMVLCVKLNKELPGLKRLPFQGELGQKIYDNISQEAFNMFKDYFLMIVNEYRLDLSSPKTDQLFLDQAKEFFFGEGGQLPDQYKPEN